MTRVMLRWCCLRCCSPPRAATAQDPRQNAPGQFDFYVLSLSWSPSFCAGAAERGATGGAGNVQCGPRPYSFVVHGLWPQYDSGFPEYCQIPAPRLNRGVVSAMLDLMPAPRLIFNEWDRHGTCSGQSPRAYFETVRRARAAVKIPPEFTDLKEPLSVTPHAVEEAFVKANPGLSASAMAIGCDARRLTEVRLCLSKDLHFRDCAEIAKRSCNRDNHAADARRLTSRLPPLPKSRRMSRSRGEVAAQIAAQAIKARYRLAARVCHGHRCFRSGIKKDVDGRDTRRS